MTIKQPINDLLAKEMDRKQFLAHIGAGLMALIGVTRLVSLITHSPSSKSSQSQHNGYGRSSYGN